MRIECWSFLMVLLLRIHGQTERMSMNLDGLLRAKLRLVKVIMKILYRYVFEGVLTLFAVLFFTTIILLVSGAPPFAAYYHIFKGSLGSWIKLGQVIQVWIPLTLCAAGLLYTFRIGLWNIGVE